MEDRELGPELTEAIQGIEFGCVIVRPGDKIVVAVRSRITMAMMDDFRQYIEEYLPGVTGVIVDDAVGLAVYRPDEQKLVREQVRETVREAVMESYGVSAEEVFGPQKVLDECGLPPERNQALWPRTSKADS